MGTDHFVIRLKFKIFLPKKIKTTVRPRANEKLINTKALTEKYFKNKEQRSKNTKAQILEKLDFMALRRLILSLETAELKRALIL